MTVSAFTSLSLDPPLVLMCIDKQADMHAVLGGTSHLAVNILAASQESLARRFAEECDDRFDGIGYARGLTGCVLLNDVLGYIEGRLVDSYSRGDHTIFVAEVEAAAAYSDRPLLYYRGGYAQLER